MPDNILPPQLLNIFYGDDFPIPVEELPSLPDWVNGLDHPIRRQWEDLVLDVNHPLNVRVPRQPDNPTFHYDKLRLNPLHLQENHRTASALLEECLALKDRFKELDRRIIEDAVSAETEKALQALLPLEQQITAYESGTMAKANRFEVSEDGEKTILSPQNGEETEDYARATLSLLQQKHAIFVKERERLDAERQTPNSPFRLIERRDRIKAKYVHLMSELILLIEAIKHGMYLVLDEKPSYAVITVEDAQSASREYQSRAGLFPEVHVKQQYAMVLQFSLLMSRPDAFNPDLFDGPLADALRNSDWTGREALLNTYTKLVYNYADMDLDAFDVENFVNKVRQKSTDPDAIEKLVRRAHNIATAEKKRLARGPDIETDIRTYLWASAKTLQADSLYREETIIQTTIRDILRLQKDQNTKWEDALKKGIAEGKFDFKLSPDMHCFHGTQDARLLGITAEVLLSPARHVVKYGYRFKRKNRYLWTPERRQKDKEGRITRFHIVPPTQHDENRTFVQFASTANFPQDSAMTSLSASPLFHGTKSIKNFNPFRGDWHMNVKLADAGATVADIAIYLHISYRAR